MLGAIVADDPLTVGVDFGDQSIVKMYDGNTVVPTFSDIIFRLVQTFFTATVTSNWQQYLPDESVTWDPMYPTAPILTHKADGTPTLLPIAGRVLPELLPRAHGAAAGQREAGDAGRR